MKKLRQILLIDDDSATNFLNERLLRSLQITNEVKVLTDGQQAFDYLSGTWGEDKTYPELVVLDHHMPVMNGLELMEKLNWSGKLDGVEVVFLLLALETSKEHLKIFRELGVQEFTDKPLCKETVMDAYHKYWAGDTANKEKSS